MPVTLFYAALLGLWLVVLSMRVINGRHMAEASFGDGGDKRLGRRIRAQANFVEYAPMGLILLGLLEATGLQPLLLHPLGALLLIGRLLHGYAFSFTDHWAFGRVGGTAITFAALVLLSSAALVVAALRVFAPGA